MTEKNGVKSDADKPNYLVLASFAGFSGLSLMAGFAYRIISLKKVHALPITQAFSNNKGINETGVHLAFRALGVATAITTSSFGALSLLIWLIMKPKDKEDFNKCLRDFFPEKWRIQPSTNNNEIRTFDELHSLLINESVNKR
uniref:Transmembrane protein 242 n=1 Tax=Trichobilharzia regenti TaxID=157069 RepID=A0AA85JP60_TRIRE|nr:unnamed protein product [Trichobilharzia regenti]